MPSYSLKSVLLFLVSGLQLLASGWDPIPAEVWKIKTDPVQGTSGAIFLQDWSRYGTRDTEHRLRILILSEAGKDAVYLAPFSPLLQKVEGRTVFPDGTVIAFSNAKDFSTQTINSSYNNSSQQVVIPPGLTDHCVVDLHWIDAGTYLWGNRFERQIQRTYPINHLELRLAKQSPLASAWLRPKSIPMVGSTDDDYRIYTFSNLPGLEVEPYSRVAWTFRPILMCFAQPAVLQGVADKGNNAFWGDYAKEFIRYSYEKSITGGRKYRALAQEILNGLPEDPISKACEIQNRLYAKVLNISAMTALEKAKRTKKEEGASVRPEDIDEAADRKWTNSAGMYYLAYQLFVDAGLSPKILRVSNRDKWAFRYDLPHAYQFDDSLLGIETADKKSIEWYDPSVRFLPVGIIDPSYQGTAALLIDPKDWSAKLYRVPVQAAGKNQREYRFEVNPLEDVDQFKVSTTFSGHEAWVERDKYFKLTTQESEALLRETLEGSKRFTIQHANVMNATDRNLPMAWEAEGTREADGSRRRKVDPFPVMECPLWIPEAWPKQRRSPVVFSYASTYTANSRIQVPDGWRASFPGDLDYSNHFGSISWQVKEVADERGQALRVSYEVKVTNSFGQPETEKDLKDFLAWVKDAWSRRINLERVR